MSEEPDRYVDVLHPLTRDQEAIATRLNALWKVQQQAETIFQPFADEKIVKALLRMRTKFEDGHRALIWDDRPRGDQAIRQIEGALTELRGIGKQMNMQLIDRMLQP